MIIYESCYHPTDTEPFAWNKFTNNKKITMATRKGTTVYLPDLTLLGHHLLRGLKTCRKSTQNCYFIWSLLKKEWVFVDFRKPLSAMEKVRTLTPTLKKLAKTTQKLVFGNYIKTQTI